MEGVTLADILEVLLLQLYVEAPLAVNVEASFLQITVLDATAVTVGLGLTVSCTELTVIQFKPGVLEVAVTI